MIEKLQWFNDNINYMFRQNIVEYDMQTASLAVSDRFGLIPKDRLIQLRNMPKDQRTRQVGLMQREDKEFSNRLIQGIIDTRQEFLDKNHISEDDIICVHSDAIIFNMKAAITDTVDCVRFIPKNAWSSYLRYNGIEIYYGNGVIDYKGIPKEMLKVHTLGINKYLLKIFNMMELCDESVLDYIRKTQTKYLQDKLPDHFYIPFGRMGAHKTENLGLFAFIANAVIGDMYEW